MTSMQLYGLIGYPLSHSFSAAYFAKKFADENGFEIKGEVISPIEGGDGNVEFLLYLC